MDQRPETLCDVGTLAALTKRIEALEGEVADLKKAFEIELKSNLEHAEATYQYIADIYDYLMPVVRKVLPDYARTQKQIDRIIRAREDKKT